MRNDEIEIMRDAFCFLRDHNDPPANNSGRLVAFWERTAFDMERLAEKWNGHLLAAVVLAGLFEYLGAKADVKTAMAWASAGGPARTTAGTAAGGLARTMAGTTADGPARTMAGTAAGSLAEITMGTAAGGPARTASGAAADIPTRISVRAFDGGPARITSRALANVRNRFKRSDGCFDQNSKKIKARRTVQMSRDFSLSPLGYI